MDKPGRLAVDALSVGRHPEQIRLITVGKMSTYETGRAVLVPHGRTVVPTGFQQKRCKRLPRSLGTSRRSHEIAFVRRTEKEIETPLMIAQSACPDAPCITRHPVPVQIVTYLSQVIDNVSANLPVHQILRMQHRHARRELECRRNGIIVVSYPDAVYIAVVRRYDRIQIRAIRLFTPSLPFSPLGLLCLRCNALGSQ